jgi:uncharacterized OB-fold protein
MGIIIFFALALAAAAVIAYPLLPGSTAKLAPNLTDEDIDHAVRDLRQARSRGGHVCPTCGRGYQAGDRFCVRCGGELPQVDAASGSVACPACGAAMQAGDRFCPKCGRGVAAEEVA